MLHLNEAEAASLVVAGLNSIVLDFAARTAVGGTDLSYFIIKQLPMLPPEAFLEEGKVGLTWAAMVVPRVLELTYTADELEPFARDLGYDGPPFPWDEEATSPPQVRTRRYLRPHVPTRPPRSGVDTGRAGSVFIVPWVET